MRKIVIPKGVTRWSYAEYTENSTYAHFAMGELFTEGARARQKGVARSLSELRRESLKEIVDDDGAHLRPAHILELDDPRLNAIWLSHKARMDLYRRFSSAWDDAESLSRKRASEARGPLAAFATAIQEHDDEMVVLPTEFDRDLDDPDIVFVSETLAPAVTAQAFFGGVDLLYDQDPECIEWPVGDLVAGVAGWWGIRPEAMEQYIKRASFLQALERLDEGGDGLVARIMEHVGENVVDDSAERAKARRDERAAFEVRARDDRLKREGAAQRRRELYAAAMADREQGGADPEAPQEPINQWTANNGGAPHVIRRRPGEDRVVNPTASSSKGAARTQQTEPAVTPSRPAVVRRRARPVLSAQPEEAAELVDSAPPEVERYTWDGAPLTFDTIIKATNATLFAQAALWHERTNGILNYRRRLSAIHGATHVPTDQLEGFMSDPRRLFWLGRQNPWVADFIGYDEDNQQVALMGHLESWQTFARWAEQLSDQEPPVEGYYHQMAFIGSKGQGGHEVHRYPATYASMCYRFWLRDMRIEAHSFPLIGLPPVPPFARKRS